MGLRKRKKPLLLLLYVVFLTVVFEGAARLFFLTADIFKRLQYVAEDTTWRRTWVRRHQKGMEIFYTFDIYDATKGWKAKPNLRDQKVFHNKVLNTNAKGLRGNREYSYDKDPARPRVLILGDSFTFGDEVSDHETYASYLQEMIPAAEIINMGVHGYGQDQMLILLREEGIRYKPDIVILGFVYEDMSRNLLQFRDYAKPKFVMENGTLRVIGSPVPRPEEILKWDWARPRVYDLWSLFLHELEVVTGRYRKQMEGMTRRLLDEMAATITDAGAVPLFVYLPVGEEITDPGKAAEREGFLLSYCEENSKVQCLSARPNFSEKLKRGVKFKTIGHWRPLGQRTVAEAIYGYLAAHHGLQLKLPVNTHAPGPHPSPVQRTVPIRSDAEGRARSG